MWVVLWSRYSESDFAAEVRKKDERATRRAAGAARNTFETNYFTSGGAIGCGTAFLMAGSECR